MELRRIHSMVFEKCTRNSQGKAHLAFQPVISWKAFQVALSAILNLSRAAF